MRNLNFLIVLLIILFFKNAQSIVCDPPVGTPINSPTGKAIGVHAGRVVWARDPKSATWDGVTGMYYDYADADVIQSMLDKAILELTGNFDLYTAWGSIFRYHNIRMYKENRGYTKGESIAIKLNLNGDFIKYSDNNGNEATPEEINALLEHLTKYGGVPQNKITVYDSSRLMTPHLVSGIHSAFPDVVLIDNLGEIEYVDKVTTDFSSHLQFSSSAIPGWNLTMLPECATKSQYIIPLDNFRGHRAAGFTLTGKNFFGSIYMPLINCSWSTLIQPTHYCPKSLHPFINVSTNNFGAYNPLVDLLGHPNLAYNGLLYMSAGVYGGASNIEEIDGKLAPAPPVKFESEPFNNHWSSSILVSLDPIALDSVGFDILRNEPNVPLAKTGCADNYLHEGSQANDPPSGTIYNPTGKKQLESLGVHEHWNNSKDRQYSRNLDPIKGKGIELVEIHF
ncbi:hypothetical protein M0813_13112 [Anaeramoeba flamelloides]|uniref:DUF362 domain-containing protein n=1 Tax=Anaeramoeba flamelloides TaxID=1746091 RepID=A0ABQ8Z9Y6_9EUKA|nr:hypothetical protein M0813_13112 [Anaeramoeba flamelloides]